jgi:hypothetical protein
MNSGKSKVAESASGGNSTEPAIGANPADPSLTSKNTSSVGGGKSHVFSTSFFSTFSDMNSASTGQPVDPTAGGTSTDPTAGSQSTASATGGKLHIKDIRVSDIYLGNVGTQPAI